MAWWSVFCLLQPLADAVAPSIAIRGVYGGVPEELMQDGRRLTDSGINAVWLGESLLTPERVDRLRSQGVKVFCEFNTLRDKGYLADHPDAAPVGPDGQRAEAPHGWQGISPTHPGWRAARMAEFRRLLTVYELDGIWLDYLHAHSSWERPDPALPDTGFDPRTLALFSAATGADLGDGPVAQIAARLLSGDLAEAWVQWNCDLLTDWVREFQAIRDEVRPGALLGSFHCSWGPDELDGALRRKLFIDLPAQARYLDVLSPMPYHARFGHHDDIDWIARQVTGLGQWLGLTGAAGERPAVWPILQASDWGEPVPADTLAAVIAAGTVPPAGGVMVFAWGSLRQQPEKIEALSRAYLELAR